MEIKRYTDSKLHRNLISDFKKSDDYYTRGQCKFYFDVQLPIIIYILQNTTFELQNDESGKSKLCLNTVKFSDINAIKSLGDHSIYFKHTIYNYIEKYLNNESSDIEKTVGKESPQLSFTNMYREMLCEALAHEKNHIERSLSMKEEKAISKLKVLTSPKIEYTSKDMTK